MVSRFSGKIRCDALTPASADKLLFHPMKTRGFICLFVLFVLMLSSCQTAEESIKIRLSGERIQPVYLTDSALLRTEEADTQASSGEGNSTVSETEETSLQESDPAESRSAQTDSPETLPPQTDPTETSPAQTDPPETRSPQTDPPETRPPQTDPPQTTATPQSSHETPHTAASVQYIEILTYPAKTVYDQYQEAITTDGMRLRAVWEDGYECVLTEGWTISDMLGNPNPRTTEEGSYTILVHYGNQTTYFAITCQFSQTVPLVPIEAYSPARSFYQGEYLRHLFLGATVGDQRIPLSQLTFSQERLDTTGLVTVTISYDGHTAERQFVVLPANQFVLTQEALDIFAYVENLEGPHQLGQRLTATMFCEHLWTLIPDKVAYKYPVLSDVIPKSEFSFDPETITRLQTLGITIYCRGLSFFFYAGLY